MSTIQYTIRNIPADVDARLRRLARLRRQSLNQVVVDRLSNPPAARANRSKVRRKPLVNTDFDDLFGHMTPLEPEVEEALRAQRVIDPKDWQ